ncbi:MAG TPA: DUF1036 domain-containing protein [Candidatus Aquilonibacter sp.]|nr:DUF1036 domain-containing protein [Candidatus Aquilonibacter sp.]
MFVRSLLVVLVIAGSFVACRGQAQAALHVCDRSPQPATVALTTVAASATGTVVQSQGWWQVDAGSCAVLIDNDLVPGVLYYLYGKSPQYFWAGDSKKNSKDAQFCANEQDGFQYMNRDKTQCTSPNDAMLWFIYEPVRGTDWTIDLYMPG